ncbi:thiamin pyrophosphokinase-related protein [Seminavis robusta]|uniref:Thiamin pyrophosphokinase-related protein n=1 Tax=Seminavis robusta TaxID=568900 RepID=A0A9N8HUE5_9STRA|nr:thiamin pyrophosphokinase-related protein [Seminavis robusta]|eukprot:Sro1737_g294470.1 thiamin pyrophosphokinase-related protein (355) ;mRNA; f:14403-15467
MALLHSTLATFLSSTPKSSPSILFERATRAASTRIPRFMSTTATVTDEKIMEDALYRVRQVNYLPDEIRSSLVDFRVDGRVLGKVRPNTANLLCSVDEKNPVFNLQSKSGESCLTLTAEAGTSPEERTKSVNRIMARLRDQGIVKGWRDEDYPVRSTFYGDTLFGVERAAASLLGIMEYGVHINGIVVDDETKTPKMWMARRAADKSKYPGMLDHIVAGGQPVGLSLMENVIKECDEEAGIPEDITRAGIQDAGAISYYTYSERNDCVTRCVLFCYDLHLPANFVPKPVDGEVQEFFLWDVDQIKASFAPDYPDPIKPNCYNVIIDWMMRCGHFSSDTPGYLDVMRELRSGDVY